MISSGSASVHMCICRLRIIIQVLKSGLKQLHLCADLYSDHGLFQRLTQIENDFSGTNRLFNKIGHLPEAVKLLWTNEKLLNMAEQLLGSRDIQGHPIWNFRPKTPRSDYGAVPWHQGDSNN